MIRFEGFEKDYADFTYTDVDGRFGQYLRGSHNVRGLEWVTEQGEKTYHLEVKTSLGGLDTAVRLSNNQISMSKKYARQFWTEETQNNVYVLVRVYGLLSNRSDPKVRFFPDPWHLICEDMLLIEGDNGILVHPRLSE